MSSVMRFFIELNNDKLEKKWNVSRELFIIRELQAGAGILVNVPCRFCLFSRSCHESYNMSEG